MRLRRKPADPALTPEQHAAQRRLSRRRFLKTAGAVGAGLVVVAAGGGALGVRYVRNNLDSFISPLSADPDAWLRVEPDGRVRLVVNKMEMGQGIATAAAQIVAHELFLPVSAITVAMGTTADLPPDSMGTAGSTSVRQLYAALRAAGATARETLIELAQQRDGTAGRSFVARDGRIVAVDDPAVGYGYGELVAERQILKVAKDAAPTPARPDSPIGQPVPRLDIPDKVVGKAVYGYDVQIDGMRHGFVVKPPVVGATVRDVDVQRAQQAPGVLAVVHTDQFVGVVTETREQLGDAVAALAVEWSEPATLLQQADVDALLVPGDAAVLRDVGAAPRVLAQAQRVVAAEYRTGFATQAPIEPQVAVADVRGDKATVWAPTQAPFGLRGQIAEIVGLDEAQVTVVPTLLGGGFGRKSVSDAAHEAARLSKAAGVPVRVAWSRGEEFTQGFVRPPTANRFQAALDPSGAIAAWQQELTTGFVLFTFFPSFLRLLFGSDFGATRGAVGPYTIANQRVSATVRELPVKTGPWRGLGLCPNGFAVEQFMDELALAAGADPLAFRLRHLASDEAGTRMRRVLETAAQQAGWGTPLPPDHGRGIACGEDAGTFVAEVAEVAVDRTTGAVQVKRVVAAVDCGLAINPDTVAAQTEGGIMMGLSAALKEEIVLKDGQWSATTFKQYPIFTIRDAPAIEVSIIPNEATAPSGMGEPPILPAAAAVGNAIAAAVGARVRTMPMTPERVLAALATA